MKRQHLPSEKGHISFDLIHKDREQHGDLISLRAAIDEGLKSGVSQRSVTDILNAKEAQLKQEGRI